MLRTIAPVFLALTLPLQAAQAGDPPLEAPVLSAASDVHARLHHDWTDSGLWVRGRSYKANAAPTGFTYIPFLGSRAAATYPIELALERATVGGAELPLEGAAEVTLDGDVVTLDRGAVRVRYELALDSVEQVFVVDTGGLEGDLQLVLDVDTDLAVGPDGAGFRFDGPEGGARYGAAFALDARGGRTPVPAAFDGGQLALTVPAWIVERSGGQVVVDPVLSTYAVRIRSANQRDADVAYDRTTDAFIFVYEDDFAIGDSDVYVRVLDAQTGALLVQTFLDISAQSWVDPSVANLNGDNVSLIAARVDGATGDAIRGRIFDHDAGAMQSGSFEIAGTGGLGFSINNSSPDVAGNNAPNAGTEFCVVWTRQVLGVGGIVQYRTVGASGQRGPLENVSQPSGVIASQVCISESTGDLSTAYVWNVAYVAESSSSGEKDIRGVQLDPGGGIRVGDRVLDSLYSSAEPVSLDVSDAIDVGGQDPTYVVTWGDANQAANDVLVVACRNNQRVGSINLTFSEHAQFGLEQGAASVGTTSEDFVVCYQEKDGADTRVWTTILNLSAPNQLAVAERRVELLPAVGATGTFERAGVASRFSGGSPSSRWVGIGWAADNGGDLDVFGATFAVSAANAVADQYCYGNPNSTGDRGFLTLTGNRSTTSMKVARASALPRAQFALLLVADGNGSVPAVGGGQGLLCLGGTIGRYVGQIQLTDVNGRAEFDVDPAALPLGATSVAAVPGDVLRFQVWHRDFVGGATSNLTNAVRLVFE